MNATLRAFLIVVSLLALLLLGILGLGSSFLPLLTAFFLAYLIYPIIQKLEKKGISRNHSLISLFVLCSVVSLIILAIILPKLVQQSQSFISELPQTVNTLAIKISESANSLGISLSLDKEGVSDTINDFAQSLSAGSIKQISTTLKGVFTNLSDLFLGLLNLFMI
ncbi:MAG: AI-2E family transporter, partial [Bdellovibrionales bacterium]|nr:AI-2E family transporter [Bdellovibrionales bacterium]